MGERAHSGLPKVSQSGKDFLKPTAGGVDAPTSMAESPRISDLHKDPTRR